MLYSRFMFMAAQRMGLKHKSSSGVAMVLALTFAAWLKGCHSQNSPQDFLAGHNEARAAMALPPLSWDSTVAAYAQDYANRRMADCRKVHSGGPYGENLFWGYGYEFRAADAIKYWVDEEPNYEYGSNSCAEGTHCLHYTQVMWRKSTGLGCARVTCRSGELFITCNYYPRGNVVGERPY